MPPHLSGADELGEQPVVAQLPADAASHDSRVYSRFPTQVQDCHRSWAFQDCSVVPDIAGNQRILGYQVRFLLLGVATRFNAPKVMVVDEAVIVAAAVQVQADVGQLVQQREPEVRHPIQRPEGYGRRRSRYRRRSRPGAGGCGPARAAA